MKRGKKNLVNQGLQPTSWPRPTLSNRRMPRRCHRRGTQTQPHASPAETSAPHAPVTTNTIIAPAVLRASRGARSPCVVLRASGEGGQATSLAASCKTGFMRAQSNRHRRAPDRAGCRLSTDPARSHGVWAYRRGSRPYRDARACRRRPGAVQPPKGLQNWHGDPVRRMRHRGEVIRDKEHRKFALLLERLD